MTKSTIKKESQLLLKKVLNSALALSEEGNIREATKYIDIAHKIVVEFPVILWKDEEIWKISKILLIMYHFDFFDDEDENILLTHLAFLYLTRAIEMTEDFRYDTNTTFEIYRTLVVLMNSCEDTFNYTIAGFYTPESKKGNEEFVSTAHKLARSIQPYLQYGILMEIDSTFSSFKGDEFLEDLCVEIENEYTEMKEEYIIEAKKIRELLFNYIKVKVAKNDLTF